MSPVSRREVSLASVVEVWPGVAVLNAENETKRLPMAGMNRHAMDVGAGGCGSQVSATA